MWSSRTSLFSAGFSSLLFGSVQQAMADTRQESTLAATQFEMVALTSRTLPNGLSLIIDHKRDWEISDPASQVDYSYFIYRFTKSDELIFEARTYLDTATKITILEPEGFDLNLAGVREAVLTLYALGFYDVEVYDVGRGFTSVAPKLSIEAQEVIDWSRKMEGAQ